MWVSASSTYNYLKDPLLDVFKYTISPRELKSVVGETKPPESDFISYIMNQGRVFERKVLKMITKKFSKDRVREINGDVFGPYGTRVYTNQEKINETIDAMKQGFPIIHNGILINEEDQTYGIFDLLVRSDWLNLLTYEDTISEEEKCIPSPVLGENYHYRVIDIKYTTLALRSDGIHLLETASFPAYKSQLLIYNNALGKVQGYTPPQAYILGRKWEYESKGQKFSGSGCFDRLAVIDYQGIDEKYNEITRKAVEWVRLCNSPEAKTWNITNYPLSRKELYPNMTNSNCGGLVAEAKNIIADANYELTQLWNVGPHNREFAHSKNIYSWNDPRCCSKTLGITGPPISKTLDSIIRINRSKRQKILPTKIPNSNGWYTAKKFEFFIDFETTNGALAPIKNVLCADTSNIIFMIGVGWWEPEGFQYKSFVVNELNQQSENEMIEKFVKFIDKGNSDQVRLFHWSNAEKHLWESSHLKNFSFELFDLLKLFQDTPITIQGCLGFGLKEVASALRQHGFISSGWDDCECTDGNTASLIARKLYDECGSSAVKTDKMKELLKYNRIDVTVVGEILQFLRRDMTQKVIAKNPSKKKPSIHLTRKIEKI